MSLLRPHLGRAGITRVANVTGLDTIGIPVVFAVRPNARSLSASQGKGLDLDAATASAILEAIEQFHAERPALPIRRASYATLTEECSVVDPGRLPKYIRPFSPLQTLLWTSAEVLDSDERVYVPYDMVHLDFRFPPRWSSGCFPLGSNGLASGNTLVEATVHGLLELIERDATALFVAMPPELQWLRRLNLETVDNVDCRWLIDSFAAAEIDVAVWDITSDVGIAAFACIIVEAEEQRFRPVGQARGYGCHLDRSVALCRALTEAAQSRLTRIVGSRDDLSAGGFEHVRGEEALARAHVLLRAPLGCPRSFAEIPSRCFATFEEDLASVLLRLREVGLDQALRVELSRKDFPISVVRTLVPGLEGAPEVPGYRPGVRAQAFQGVAEP